MRYATKNKYDKIFSCNENGTGISNQIEQEIIIRKLLCRGLKMFCCVYLLLLAAVWSILQRLRIKLTY